MGARPAANQPLMRSIFDHVCPRFFARALPGLGLIFAVSCARLHAEEGPARKPINYAAHMYSVESGLPHIVVSAIVQSHDGYLWIGTESGLARFDGVRFVNFRAASTPG